MVNNVSRRVAEDVGDVYQDVVHSLSKMARHIGEDAGDTMSKSGAALVDAASDFARQARETSVKAAKGAGRQMRTHPAATAALAIAAVAVIGLALGQRTRPATRR